MVKKLLECPNCGKSSSQWIDKEQHPIFKKMKTILKSKKTPHEKKMALFNCLKEIDVGDLKPIENERFNSLMLGKVYHELAKQCMKEYKKLTVKEYSEEK
ncbi:hypothetical protein C1645_834760 [Glomus cerebriforme]|uniref:Uncharacterized protein n=1 Tax=Glomus cerebriforme TaxID=658196 RepID=A0A397S949_9GLOM|nr:hypothetical protein C1645_834760 [Glomus cerebriforme]